MCEQPTTKLVSGMTGEELWGWFSGTAGNGLAALAALRDAVLAEQREEVLKWQTAHAMAWEARNKAESRLADAERERNEAKADAVRCAAAHLAEVGRRADAERRGAREALTRFCAYRWPHAMPNVNHERLAIESFRDREYPLPTPPLPPLPEPVDLSGGRRLSYEPKGCLMSYSSGTSMWFPPAELRVSIAFTLVDAPKVEAFLAAVARYEAAVGTGGTA